MKNTEPKYIKVTLKNKGKRKIFLNTARLTVRIMKNVVLVLRQTEDLHRYRSKTQVDRRVLWYTTKGHFI